MGTLYEIKPEEGTIALEDVVSYGTEDRPSQTFVPPSNQRFDFIKFKGQDVKDIKSIEESEAPKPEPQQMPNDPAILVSNTLLSAVYCYSNDEIFSDVNHRPVPNAQSHVDISVAFLLIEHHFSHYFSNSCC